MSSKTYESLSNFIEKMEVPPFFLPVALIELLKRSGKSKEGEIVKQYPKYYPHQPAFNEVITKSILEKALEGNDWVKKSGDKYYLTDFDKLHGQENKYLTSMVEQRLRAFVALHGMRVSQQNLIDQAKFELIKEKYGHFASWAVWAEEGDKPKSNMGDLTIFDEDNYANLLHQLNPNVILVGLNISKRIEKPLANFHGSGGGAFNIRYALKDTPLWGSYMTDIIKDFEQVLSGKVMSELRKNKSFEEENVQTFRDEIRDLGVNNPTIVAFGVDSYKILKRNFKDKYLIHQIPHYSNYIAKEKYRVEVKSILGF
jgi:hypothetical protein